MMVINVLLDTLGTPASKFFFWFLDPNYVPAVQFALEVISILVVLLLITLLGYGSKLFIGRWILNRFEHLLDRVPFINTVYRTVKQIVDTFSKQQKAVFRKPCCLSIPARKHVLGFTSEAKGETQKVTGEEILNIFVPTTPNPTTGFLLMVPKEDITRLNMSVTDGMKLIISGGAVVPPESDEAVVMKTPRPWRPRARRAPLAHTSTTTDPNPIDAETYTAFI